MSSRNETTFDVADMTCGHCVSAITRAVKTADPQAEVRVDLATKQVRIQSAGSSVQILKDAIEEAGFTPVPIAA